MIKNPHPNIVQVLDFVEPPTAYVVMEFCAWGTLADSMLSEWQYCASLYQTLAAIAHLHARDIVHRDIKPANVLVVSKDPLHIKLADFGFAKLATVDDPLKTFCGTYSYVSPEMAVSRGMVVGPAIDFWSAGVMFLELLYNLPQQTPLPSSENELPLWAQQWCQRIETYAKDLDDDTMTELLVRMLEIDPARRLSAEECIAMGIRNDLFTEANDTSSPISRCENSDGRGDQVQSPSSYGFVAQSEAPTFHSLLGHGLPVSYDYQQTVESGNERHSQSNWSTLHAQLELPNSHQSAYWPVSSPPGSTQDGLYGQDPTRSESAIEKSLLHCVAPSVVINTPLCNVAMEKNGEREDNATNSSLWRPLTSNAEGTQDAIRRRTAAAPSSEASVSQPVRLDEREEVQSLLHSGFRLLAGPATHNFPYQSKRKHEASEPVIPDWWPIGLCPWKAPDHVSSVERTALLVHLLQLRPTLDTLCRMNHNKIQLNYPQLNAYNGAHPWTDFLRELAPADTCGDLPTGVTNTLRQIYNLAAAEEAWLNGAQDGQYLTTFTIAAFHMFLS
ncbi:hypothetical protein LTR62_001611 [Meristemomyces frigidus]|uniref:non-specific serine/threonine protein kinase n=1 Tax=Meristemomyces frigidus TaxID=1508187 RepID=A0AAN7T844_9PEZI|nr:hypothetical protein LTR62_001611 [Meristemomyces frigidus]